MPNQPVPKSKLEEVINGMGKTYLCHPSNHVKRKTPFRRSIKSLRAALGNGGA